MDPTEALFAKLQAEKATGSLYTLRDWLAEHPPPDDSFKQTLAGVARQLIEGEPFPYPVRDFLDEFALLATDEQKQRSIAAGPDATGDPRFDSYLGALAEHLAAQHGLSTPDWVREPDRFLDSFWFPSKVVGFRAIAIAQSPAAFRRRGIFISTDSLVRV